MEPNSLSQFYDNLKTELDKPAEAPAMTKVHLGPGGFNNSPGAAAWRNKAADHCEHLKDECRKRLLVDIYCHILPLDADFIASHKDMMHHDVDHMLAKKNMTPTQYMTSAYESTNAPFIKYMIDMTNLIGKKYMKEADDTLKDAQENDVPINEPAEPSVDDAEVQSQLVDIKNDVSADNFMDMLRQKTIDKIVKDVSDKIDSVKDDNNMQFDTNKNESAFGVCMDYLQKQMISENVEPTMEQKEQMIGLAIREATLNQLDVCFNLPDANNFNTRIRMGRGAVINESAVTDLMDKDTKTETKTETE